MKISTIIYSYSPYTCGGADIYAEQISKHLAQRGHESVVITTRPYSGMNSLKPLLEYRDKVKIYRFYPLNLYFLPNPPRSTYLRAIWSLIDTWNPHSYYVVKSILAREKPDVVHLHSPVSLSLSMFSAVKSLKLPLILTVHDYHLLCKRTFLLHGNGDLCTNPRAICSFYRRVSRLLASGKPDIVISPSQFALDMMLNAGFFVDAAKFCLPNGVQIPKQPEEKIQNEYLDLLYLGAVSKHKGVHLLIQAFRQVKDQNLRLHIAGAGSDLGEFKNMAEGDPRIKFYGFISGETKDELFKLADLLVLPTIWYENSPNVIRESFASGIPVIASNIGGIPEMVKSGYNGALFEAGNVDELRGVLEELAQDPSKVNRLSKIASESARQYDIEEHVNQLESLYQEIGLRRDEFQ